MPFLNRLIDRAAVYRWSVSTLSGVRERTGSYSAVSGSSAVPCLLLEGRPQVVVETFGRDLSCDAIAHFAAGSNVGPSTASADGRPDKLVVTEKSGRVTTWLVVAAQNAGNRGRGLVVALQKWTD